MKEADPPIDEIREIRHRISEEFGHDPKRIVAYYSQLDEELSERSEGPVMAVGDSIPRKLTYEDYLLFPEDGRRHELIDGEHFVSSAPSRTHQRLVLRLGVLLGNFLEENPLGEVLLGPFDVILTEHDVVQPDLLFVSNERAAIWTEQGTRGAPDLVIEVLSPETRRVDETLKLSLYEREGVREYWMFDPERKTARIFRRDGGRLVAQLDLSAAAGDVLETPLLPGLLIPLAKVFR